MQVGDYFIYPELSVLQTESGDVIEMECMAIDVLSYMASRCGEVISIDELMEQVWTGKIVTHSTVRRIISLIRKAFNDDVKSPNYIQNIPKRGYVLIAQVTHLTETNSRAKTNKVDIPTLHKHPSSVSPPPVEGERPRWRQQHLAFVITLVAIACLALLLFTTPVQWQTERDVTPVISVKGAEKDVDYSETLGKMLYAHKGEGDPYWQLFSFDNANNLSRQLTTGPYDSTRPQFSPDGSKIAFLRAQTSQFSIIVASLSAEGELTEMDAVYDSPLPIGNIIWNEYGDSLIFTATDERYMYSVFSLNLKDGSVNRLTLPATNSGGDYLVALSTDKQYLAVARLAGNETEIIGYRLEGFSPAFFKKVNAIVKSLSWHQQGLLYLKGNTIFSIAEEYDWEERVWHEGNNLISQFRAVGGRVFAIQGDLSNSEIRQFTNPYMQQDLNSDDLTISSPQRDFSGAYSHTSERIYFLSHRSGLRQIWQWDAQTGYQQLTDLSNYQQIDNLQAAYHGEYLTGTIGRQLFILDVQDRKLDYLSPDNHYVSRPVWSLDGQYIYYINQYLGEHELWRVNTQTGQVTRLDKNMTSILPYKGDDVFIGHDNQAAFIYTLSSGERDMIDHNIPLQMNVSWQRVNQHLYWTQRSASGTDLMRLDLATLDIEQQQAPVSGLNHRFSIKPDESHILFNVSSAPQTNVVELH